MKMFLLGTLFGIIVNTVGLTGLARMVDTGINKIQSVSKTAAEVTDVK